MLDRSAQFLSLCAFTGGGRRRRRDSAVLAGALAGSLLVGGLVALDAPPALAARTASGLASAQTDLPGVPVPGLPVVPMVDPAHDPVVAPVLDGPEDELVEPAPESPVSARPEQDPVGGGLTPVGGSGDATVALLVDPTTTGQDLTGDGVPDVLARDSDGRLWTYPGTGSGGFATRVQSGVGWAIMDQVHVVGNWNGVGGNDVIARKPSTGQLFLYPGNGNATFGSAVPIGVGWN